MTQSDVQQAPPVDPFGDMHPYRDMFEIFAALPAEGLSPEEVVSVLESVAAKEDRMWESGQVSGTIYHGGKDHYAFLNHVFGLFSHANLLQRDMCPSGTKFESEITAMVAKMLHGDAVKQHNPEDEVSGTVTSGGTESICNAVYVYREWGRTEKGIAHPQMIAPTTIHPAFRKAAHYYDVEIVTVPVNEDYEADVEAMAAQITPNTVALAASAGNYPHGVVDPIPRLSELALSHGIGLHVDGCLGGFILPWIERLGYDVPVFDFRLPGVTSISCDTHKFGYALKGTSTVLYRNRQLRRYQYFEVTDWQGGLYASPTAQGSRSEGLTAATWAAMVTMGEEGYLRATRAIMTAADKIRAGIATIPELKIIGKSTFLIALTSDVVDIYHVNDYLAMKGWRMNGTQSPPGFHFCMTLPQSKPGVAERFIEDLRAGVEYAKHPAQPEPKSGAVYGVAASPDGRVWLDGLMLDWLDATYSLPG